MEKVAGGELFDRIVQKSYYNEKEARDTCVTLLRAIQYCHSKQVAHRDLKPQNLLLLSTQNDTDIKLADFGFAKSCPNDHSLRTQCGTPGYVAPEILEGVAYGTKSDLWSLGVIMYILLGGYPPFTGKDNREMFRKIRKGQYKFHEGMSFLCCRAIWYVYASCFCSHFLAIVISNRLLVGRVHTSQGFDSITLDSQPDTTHVRQSSIGSSVGPAVDR
mmetsp:Transcript_30832/g.72349  ORF Transcript_30832/g.72349 Transcript_30832/m.72349 type:complete len:217 (-) Transcript_30832:137-787(-)